MTERVAVVLFNLGGPDGPADVQPFLKNLFSDPAIIQAPALVRFVLARLISTTRAKAARANYAKMGGGSPLLRETQKQADALEADLKARGMEAKCFISMRYWKPFAKDAVQQVKAWKPDRVVLLPLYPQFSTTTTASSLKSWKDAGGPAAEFICCFPVASSFIDAHVGLIRESWDKAGKPDNVRVLLSAHGLPEKVIEAGDPYQRHVEATAAAIRKDLPSEWEVEVCYQSRVGPLKWIGPPTDEAIRKAARDGKSILVVPVAFVSEHIETLVELDEEYGHVAQAENARHYIRAPALGISAGFISTLADLVRASLAPEAHRVRPSCGDASCPAGRCPDPAIARSFPALSRLVETA
jgi:ferrochelatase